jgi:hypothetical protein
MIKSKGWPLVLILLAVSVVAGGCAVSGVQVCRPDPLEHPEIRFDDTAHRYVIDDHVYFSKEGSGGGHGLGGGGCGCN